MLVLLTKLAIFEGLWKCSSRLFKIINLNFPGIERLDKYENKMHIVSKISEL